MAKYFTVKTGRLFRIILEQSCQEFPVVLQKMSPSELELSLWFISSPDLYNDSRYGRNINDHRKKPNVNHSSTLLMWQLLFVKIYIQSFLLRFTFNHYLHYFVPFSGQGTSRNYSIGESTDSGGWGQKTGKIILPPTPGIL